jgi:hypothetical protein
LRSRPRRECYAQLRVFASMCAMPLLFGCAATGVQVTQEQAQSFQVGRSTYADVVGTLGQPTTVTSVTNGQKYAVYSYAAVQSRPQNFIPYIGPLVAGYDSKSSAVTFVFDPRDVLVSSSSTQSNMGTGVGCPSKFNSATAVTILLAELVIAAFDPAERRG